MEHPHSRRLRRSVAVVASVAALAASAMGMFTAPAAALPGTVRAAGDIAPVVSYDFDGSTTDSSGNGHDAAWSGNSSYVDGIDGQAAVVGGYDYLSVPQTPETMAGSKDFSVSFWYKGISDDAEGPIFSNQDQNDARNPGLAVYDYSPDGVTGTTRLSARVASLGSVVRQQQLFDVGCTWNYVTVVVDRGHRQLITYRNGQAVATSSILSKIGSLSSGQPFRIGSDGSLTYAADHTAYGYVDDFDFYNAAVTPTQVKNDFEATKPSADSWSDRDCGSDGSEPAPGTAVVDENFEGLNSLPAGWNAGSDAPSWSVANGTLNQTAGSIPRVLTIGHHLNNFKLETDFTFTNPPTSRRPWAGMGIDLHRPYPNFQVGIQQHQDNPATLDFSYLDVNGIWQSGHTLAGATAPFSMPQGKTVHIELDVWGRYGVYYLDGQKIFSYDKIIRTPNGPPGLTFGGGGTASFDNLKITALSGFRDTTQSIPGVVAGGDVHESLAGLWNGPTVPQNFTKVSGDDWLSVSSDGTVTGTAPAPAVGKTATITVQAADGDSTSTIAVKVPVRANAAPYASDYDYTASSAPTATAVSLPLNGLVPGAPLTGVTKVSGNDWLSVSSDGVVSGTTPSSVPDQPGVITVRGTQGDHPITITIYVPVAAAATPHFVNDDYTIPAVPAGRQVRQDVSGLWVGSKPTSFSKVSGADWLSVSSTGIVSGTAPRPAPDDPGLITVGAAGSTSKITIAVPVLGSGQQPTITAASWNLGDNGSHAYTPLSKELAAVTRAGLDVIGVQESDGAGAKTLADALGWHSYQSSGDLGIVSAYPISDVTAPTDAVPAAGVTLDVSGRKVRVWATHLDESDYGPDRAAEGKDDLVAHERQTIRYQQAQAVQKAIGPDLAKSSSTPVILLGDLASPSGSDWTAATSADHDNAGAVDWPVPKLFTNAGMKDSLRIAYPDPTANPANTYSLVGSEGATDRVDYVDYAGKLQVIDAEAYYTGTPDPLPDVAGNDWPSDHAAAVTLFQLRAQR